jgi:hypothetical protein
MPINYLMFLVYAQAQTWGKVQRIQSNEAFFVQINHCHENAMNSIVLHRTKQKKSEFLIIGTDQWDANSNKNEKYQSGDLLIFTHLHLVPGGSKLSSLLLQGTLLVL